MATRAKQTFQKRQKEMARRDKQMRKAERRAQRKLDNRGVDGQGPDETESPAEIDPNTEVPEV